MLPTLWMPRLLKVDGTGKRHPFVLPHGILLSAGHPSPREMMSKPCPQMDTKGTIIGDAKHPDMFAVRTCAENGSWVENRTNFSLCITNMAVRIRRLL
ncbi:uncharacterized protein CEXT_323331 [Caerostris extrusa]|uniref:Sushi domain-containing protein n=1 Tax=Caerostris extrusa TaxID=172846 RepID=A0AAV4VHK7_CAEEX|nr:uncharacterized protein CEXT_323331 [Caerostris extrusa]